MWSLIQTSSFNIDLRESLASLEFREFETLLRESSIHIMAKEKNYNPVQAQHKADKARAIKKGTEKPRQSNPL